MECHSNPPLLQTYTAPSGPMAAPFGPPPVSPTTVTRPSGVTRVSVPRLISTSSTLPSGMAMGPSGNWRPSASTRASVIRASLHAEAVLVPGSRGPPTGRLREEAVAGFDHAEAGALVGHGDQRL